MGVVFVGGNLALDFVGTLNERGGSRVENLVTPAELTTWLVEAGIVDAPPAADQADLSSALRLREALFRVVAALIDGEAIPQSALTTVNRFAAVAPPSVRVTRSGRKQRAGDVAAGLAAIARDGLDLFDRQDDAALKWCADEACTHPFLDRSRGHRRRWCDMGACGDRAKAAAYRARQRQDRPAASVARR